MATIFKENANRLEQILHSTKKGGPPSRLSERGEQTFAPMAA